MAEFNKEIFFTKGVNVRPVSFTDADTTVAKQVFAPQDPASRIVAFAIASTSATQRVLLVTIHNLNNTEKAILGTITVPAGAGTNGSVKVVSGLNKGDLTWLQVDSDGNPFLDLNFNMTIEMNLLTALAADETITVTTAAGSYAA